MNAAAVPRCAHLRTKAMYVQALAAEAFSEEQSAPPCWCNRTLRELGPDGEPAALQACSDAARPCHRATGQPGSLTVAVPAPSLPAAWR